MAQKLQDRIFLRQLKKSFNSKLFGKQNQAIGTAIAMDPAWIHQSRLNYRYIFNQLNSYWPDWATLQFSPFQTNSTPPKSGISCLNTSTRQCFSFFTQNQNHRLDINNRGYISFPYLHWGVSLKIFENNEFHPFFQSPLHLDPKLSQINYSHVDDQKLTSSFNLNYCKETSTARIEIKFKNASDFPIKKSLNLGAVPYTNEGVGGIRSIQYRANHQLIINDSSSITVSEMPNNIVCAPYNEGNIFECSKKWDMIFSATCDEFLASGLFNFVFDLAPNKKVSLSLNITHATTFITPLFFPIQKLNQVLFSPPEDIKKEPQIVTDMTLFNANKLPSKFQAVPLITQNFLLNINHVHSIYTTEDLIFTLRTLLKLNAESQINAILSRYDQRPQAFLSSSYLSKNQATLFNHLLVFDALYDYRFTPSHSLKSMHIKARQLIKRDSFYLFIKKLSIKRFNHYIKSQRCFDFVLKLFIYLFITNKMNAHNISSTHSKECQTICKDFIKIIVNDTTLLHTFSKKFVETTSLTSDQKLFLSHMVFKFVLPVETQTSINQGLESHYWFGHHCIDKYHYNGISEKLDLLFSNISTAEITHNILSDYMKHTNSFGHYHNVNSAHLSFESFPSPMISHHAIFLHSFFNLISFTSNKILHIPVMMHFSFIDIKHIHTPFGPLSLSFKSSGDMCVHIIHEFTTSPKQIILYCPPNFTHYQFSNQSGSHHAITDHQVTLPLNESKIYLLKP